MGILQKWWETLETHHQSELPAKTEREDQRELIQNINCLSSNIPIIWFHIPIKEGGPLQKKRRKLGWKLFKVEAII